MQQIGLMTGWRRYSQNNWCAQNTIRTPTAGFQPGIILLLLLCLLPAIPAQAEVTESNLRSAILKRAAFTPQEMVEMDLNSDGKVDVADLVKHITAVNKTHFLTLRAKTLINF